jgi:hypothetical protein
MCTKNIMGEAICCTIDPFQKQNNIVQRLKKLVVIQFIQPLQTYIAKIGSFLKDTTYE